MPVVAAGLALNLLGALFLYVSTPDDLHRAAAAGDEGDPRGEVWRPDQDIEGVVGWLRSRHKRKFGFLLLCVGFALQLIGYFVPGSGYVM